MPYVKDELRTALEFINPLPSNAGELNYAISHLIHRYVTVTKKGVSYANCNEVMGVLSCVQAEFYRTVVAPYENLKAAENGPVTELDKPFFENLDGPVQVSGPTSLDVTGLAEALAAALSKPRGAVPPKQRRSPAPKAEPVQAPAAAPENNGLKPGESRVLTGPIPGDFAGKEVKTVPVKAPAGPKPPPPGPDSTPAERAMYDLAEGDEF